MSAIALADALRALVCADAALMAQLRAVRALGLASWCIGAGAIRNRVWDVRFGGGVFDAGASDVDVVYHDDLPWTPSRDAGLAAALRLALPGVAWEVVHQGHVAHDPPHASLEAGLASWPETATAVGVALRDDETLEVIAPFGLDDLFDGVLRPNPGCADPVAWRERYERKGWASRWPGARCLASGQAPPSAFGRTT